MTGGFVVIARHVHHLTALACLAQYLLHHIVVALLPVPGFFSCQPSTISPTR
jgi:hypothetical protein